MTGWIDEGRAAPRFGLLRTPGRSLLCGLLLLALAPMAQASSSRATRQGTVRAAYLDPDQVYFRKALMQRRLDVVVPARLRTLQIQPNGMLPDTPFVSYLRWRRSLNPLTFDTRHPYVRQMILRDELVRASVLKPPTITTPQAITPPTVRPAVVPPPPAVPEPSSLAIVSLLFGAAAWARHRRRILASGRA